MNGLFYSVVSAARIYNFFARGIMYLNSGFNYYLLVNELNILL